jgi:hypothetical protein
MVTGPFRRPLRDRPAARAGQGVPHGPGKPREDKHEYDSGYPHSPAVPQPAPGFAGARGVRRRILKLRGCLGVGRLSLGVLYPPGRTGVRHAIPPCRPPARTAGPRLGQLCRSTCAPGPHQEPPVRHGAYCPKPTHCIAVRQHICVVSSIFTTSEPPARYRAAGAVPPGLAWAKPGTAPGFPQLSSCVGNRSSPMGGRRAGIDRRRRPGNHLGDWGTGRYRRPRAFTTSQPAAAFPRCSPRRPGCRRPRARAARRECPRPRTSRRSAAPP